MNENIKGKVMDIDMNKCMVQVHYTIGDTESQKWLQVNEVAAKFLDRVKVGPCEFGLKKGEISFIKNLFVPQQSVPAQGAYKKPWVPQERETPNEKAVTMLLSYAKDIFIAIYNKEGKDKCPPLDTVTGTVMQSYWVIKDQMEKKGDNDDIIVTKDGVEHQDVK